MRHLYLKLNRNQLCEVTKDHFRGSLLLFFFPFILLASRFLKSIDSGGASINISILLRHGEGIDEQLTVLHTTV